MIGARFICNVDGKALYWRDGFYYHRIDVKEKGDIIRVRYRKGSCLENLKISVLEKDLVIEIKRNKQLKMF